LWYDDYKPGVSASPVTPDLVSVLSYSTGIDKNDTELLTYFGQPRFPYQQEPWSGKHNCDCGDDQSAEKTTVTSYVEKSNLGVAAPEVLAAVSPNPVINTSTVRYRVEQDGNVQISVNDVNGKPVQLLSNKRQPAGTYSLNWQAQNLAKGTYFITIVKDGAVKQTIRVVKQ
jgi:hypothetical protein